MTLIIITSIILVVSAVVIILTPMKKPPELTVAPKPKITKEQKEAFEVFKIALNTGNRVWINEQTYCQKIDNGYIYVNGCKLETRQLNIQNFINDWYKNN